MLRQELFHVIETAIVGIHHVGADGAMDMQIEHAGSEQSARKTEALCLFWDFNFGTAADFYDYAVVDDDDSIFNALERRERSLGGQDGLHRTFIVFGRCYLVRCEKQELTTKDTKVHEGQSKSEFLGCHYLAGYCETNPL